MTKDLNCHKDECLRSRRLTRIRKEFTQIKIIFKKKSLKFTFKKGS